jgi:hypothetical protein
MGSYLCNLQLPPCAATSIILALDPPIWDEPEGDGDEEICEARDTLVTEDCFCRRRSVRRKDGETKT